MTTQLTLPFADLPPAETKPDPEPVKPFSEVSVRDIIMELDPNFDPDSPEAQDGEWAAFSDWF